MASQYVSVCTGLGEALSVVLDAAACLYLDNPRRQDPPAVRTLLESSSFTVAPLPAGFHRYHGLYSHAFVRLLESAAAQRLASNITEAIAGIAGLASDEAMLQWDLVPRTEYVSARSRESLQQWLKSTHPVGPTAAALPAADQSSILPRRPHVWLSSGDLIKGHSWRSCRGHLNLVPMERLADGSPDGSVDSTVVNVSDSIIGVKNQPKRSEPGCCPQVPAHAASDMTDGALRTFDTMQSAWLDDFARDGA